VRSISIPPLQDILMNVPSSLRLKPLAACLAAAFAIVPCGALLADPAHPIARPQSLPHTLKGSHIAQWLATSPGLTRKGLSLQQVMDEAVARARAASPPPPDRPPGVTSVTSCDDTGMGTLRGAMTTAVSGDVIDLTGLSCSTITLTSGAISATVDDLTINGPGAAALSVDARGNSGVINHYGTGTIAINGLTITHGRIAGYDHHGGACVLSAGNIAIADSTVSNCYSYTAHAYGGALCAVGSVTLSQSTLSGNTTKGHYYYYYYVGYGWYYFSGGSRGGGAYAGGRFTITNSSISHNKATQSLRGSVGGGLFTRASGDLISGSTIDNNYAWLGGGIELLGHFGGEPYGATIVNSTISGNTALNSAGGLQTFYMSYVTLHNTTITDNDSAYCGGAYVYYGAADIQSSIIAGNTAVYSQNQFGLYTAADFDVFYSNATVTGGHDAIMTSNAPLPADTITGDPLLVPLADNGGPTMTHALDPISIAIDAGSNPDNLDNDQRGAGFPRVSGAAADIGAYEVSPIPDEIFRSGFD
jgi:hypothetical protein